MSQHFILNYFPPLCVCRSHQPLSCKDGKLGGVGLEAEVVLTGRVSCEGEFAEFTVAFGHLNLESKNDTVRTNFQPATGQQYGRKVSFKGFKLTNQPASSCLSGSWYTFVGAGSVQYLMIWVSDCQCDAEVRGAGGLLQIPRLQQEIPWRWDTVCHITQSHIQTTFKSKIHFLNIRWWIKGLVAPPAVVGTNWQKVLMPDDILCLCRIYFILLERCSRAWWIRNTVSCLFFYIRYILYLQYTKH